MKPKDQVIDVEKPRERPTLWRPDGEAKEILPTGLHHNEEEAIEARERERERELGGGAREVVVCADDRELCHSEDARHVVETEVEFVVTDGGGVVTHTVH